MRERKTSSEEEGREGLNDRGTGKEMINGDTSEGETK